MNWQVRGPSELSDSPAARIELLVAERAHGGCRGGAVALHEVDRLLLRAAGVLARVVRVQLVHRIPGHAFHRLAGGELLREVDLDRVHRPDVMHQTPTVRLSCEEIFVFHCSSFNVLASCTSSRTPFSSRVARTSLRLPIEPPELR